MKKKRCSLDILSISFKCFNNRKGQVTIFIIIGILLVLALLLVVFLSREGVIFKPEDVSPTDKGKVENYVTSCIDRVGQEALYSVGLQGGYVTVPRQISDDASLSLRLSPMNVVPYWAYGNFKAIPELEEIKKRIDIYIENNMRECVFSLEPFQNIFDVVEKSGISSDTEIVDSKVIFNVHWNIEVKDKSGIVVSEVLEHNSESPIKLKRTYETARRIIEQEFNSLKLEDLTQDLIALEHSDVPLAGFELSCSKKTWDAKKAEETLQNMVRYNLKKLKVTGTEYVDFPEEFPYYQNHYIWDLGEDFYAPDVSVVFNYENNYPFTFQVTPNSGGRMVSGSLGGTRFLSFLCLQNWKFTYDVIYPVMVRVTDDTTGYDFNIALTVHLIKNQPNRAEIAYSRPSETLDFGTADEFCNLRDVPMTVTTWELFDNNEEIYDNSNPLEDVNISFTCLKYRCDLGATEYNFVERGHQAGLETNFPYCVGGILRGEKEGYKESWDRVVTKAGDVVELNMVPLMEFPAEKVKIIIHNLIDGNADVGKEMDKTDLALVKFSFDKEIPYRLDVAPYHEQSLIVAEEFYEDVVNEQKLEFLAEADYTYQLEVSLMNKEGGFAGGYKANWTVDWDELANAEELQFHVVAKEDAPNEEIFEMITALEIFSTYVPEPEFN
jgi:hypothetical protein